MLRYIFIFAPACYIPCILYANTALGKFVVMHTITLQGRISQYGV